MNNQDKMIEDRLGDFNGVSPYYRGRAIVKKERKAVINVDGLKLECVNEKGEKCYWAGELIFYQYITKEGRVGPVIILDDSKATKIPIPK